MAQCPVKHPRVSAQLCGLHYPQGCGSRCHNHYKRWLKEEKEVRELEENYSEMILKD